MAEPTKNYGKWRASRHVAGVHRRYRMLTHIPFRRLHLLTSEGYRITFMSFKELCYRRWLKLRLGGRKVRVALYIIVVEKGEITNDSRT